MSEPTPPPDQPLRDQARARIRAELLETAQTPAPAGHGWLIPTTAAAAVVLVVAVTAWAVGSGGDPGESVDPADTAASERPTHSPTPANFEPDPASCRAVVEGVPDGAELAVELPVDDEASSTSFWVAGDQFAVCDVRGGIVGVRGPLPLEPDLDDRSTFRFSFTGPPSEMFHPGTGVAGGIVPDGALAYDISFAFPDGQTADATKTTDDAGRTWWWLVHTTESDAGGNVRVTLSLSGVQRTYSVPWGLAAD